VIGLLLDLDGTLVDSTASIVAGLRAALLALGRTPPSEDALRACIGLPLAHVWARLGLASGEHASAQAGYRAWAATADVAPPAPFPGIPALLADLHGAGRSLVLATAKDPRAAVRAVECQGWAHLFHAACGAEPGDGPDKSLVVARAVRALPAQARAAAVMVGDSPLDGRAAAIHAVPFIACTWGVGRRAELVACAPLAIVDSVAELRSILLP
jgi:phosphoglycolate phosphatase